jgi:hypothetical protein
VIGVSMVSGTLGLTDTMQKAFDGHLRSSYEQTDAVIAARRSSRRRPNQLDDGSRVVLTKVRALPEVEGASGHTSRRPRSTGADSSVRGRQGRRQKESLGKSVDPANAGSGPLKSRTGDWPAGADKVAIDAGRR